ncbi:MAG: MerR family transcriptional regulator [Bacteroidota bacterium]|nr:MerR family transcriptional regulator [Bacteroidota bacterium]MDP4232884.1 MerR family transcriptional regulator [Bacteroidota bacterium]MDP4241928.1 MerR family transcriptional regulator [Bacteroidota bacterium]MDP4286831.1 MerR family transcriptional regulator [Bacteroidota bacterium]
MGIQGEFFERRTPAESPTMNMEESDAAAAGSVATGPSSDHHSGSSGARRMMKDLSIPKLYYSISEVSRLTGLEAYVLRYWESEFELRPQKNRAGNRIYSNRDIKFILRIKELLREKRYTIEGAKHILRSERIGDAKADAGAHDAASELPPDPAQMTLPSDAPKPAQTPLTLDEIRSMKSALEELRGMLRAS